MRSKFYKHRYLKCVFISVFNVLHCDQEKHTFTNLKGLECNDVFRISRIEQCFRQFDDSFNLIEWDSSSFVALGIRH